MQIYMHRMQLAIGYSVTLIIIGYMITHGINISHYKTF